MARPQRSIPWVDAEPNGVLHVYWWDPVGQRSRRRSLGTRDPAEATARFQAFLAECRPLYAPTAEDLKRRVVEAGPLTVGQVLDLYEREHVDQNVTDKARARDAMANLRAFFGAMAVADVSFAKSREYVLAREIGAIGGKGRRGPDGAPMTGSPATCRRELTTLIAAVNHCLKHGHLASDGLRRDMHGRVALVELPPDSAPRQRWLTHAELAALRAACGETGRLRWFLEIAYYTGSRRDAIETLTWFQVDMERGRINLAKPGERQTSKRRPVVPIDPQLRPWLEQAREKATGTHVLGSDGSMFRPFMSAAARAGLGPDVTPHTMRHTRATHLLQAGKSPWAVANLLGDTVTTVERVYGSHSADFMAEILADEGGSKGGR